jgi:hypothetical protein
VGKHRTFVTLPAAAIVHNYGVTHIQLAQQVRPTMKLLTKFSPIRAIAGLGFVVLLLGAASANATHKTEHRYTVWGEIRYEDGTPAADIAVRLLVKGGQPLGSVQTDNNGRYRILLHVHNPDLNKVFDMRVNNVMRKVRLLFNPNDRETERGQRVDLIVKREGETETSSNQTQ